MNIHGARTWVAKVSSIPSSVWVRSLGITPALLTRTSSRSSCRANTWTKSPTAAQSARSQTAGSTLARPAPAGAGRSSCSRWCTMATACQARSWSRARTCTRAPESGEPHSGRQPQPSGCPVTRTTLPCIGGGPRARLAGACARRAPRSCKPTPRCGPVPCPPSMTLSWRCRTGLPDGQPTAQRTFAVDHPVPLRTDSMGRGLSLGSQRDLVGNDHPACGSGTSGRARPTRPVGGW